MKLIADLHTHTIASTHAYSTLAEMVACAKQLGYCAMAVTDHAPASPDAPHIWYFSNLLHQPDILPGNFLLLKGAEVNGTDAHGRLDIDEKLRGKMDWVVVSLHRSVIEPLTFEQATNFWLRIAETPYVDMIGHSEQREYAYDYERVTKAFAQHNKVVEVNANSCAVRPGNEDNLRKLVLACKQNGTKLAVNSDAHSIYAMDNKAPLLALLAELGVPERQVVNSSKMLLLQELALHGRAIAGRVEGLV